jgi:hypothetical protein
MNDEKNILPILFGSNIWRSIDSFISVMDDIPTENDRKNYFNFFKSLETTIPCEDCRNSYNMYSKELDTNIYNLDNYKKKENLISMVFKLREKVNEKIGIDYGITLNYYKLKLKNIPSPNDKNVEYIMFNMYNAPFFQEQVQNKIYSFMEKEKYDINKIKLFINTIKNFMKNITDKDISFKNKTFKLFVERNKKCLYLKNKIQKNQIKNNLSLKKSFINNKQLYLKLFNLGCCILTNEEINYLL